MSVIPRPDPSGARRESPAIAVFAFKRPDLLRLTLGSLERADGFDGLAVHIFSEAPRAGRADDAEAVNAVRALLRDWSETHRATVHEAPLNLGLRKSIVGGVTAVLNDHDSIIVLEDDLILSKCFLRFMTDALDACRDREDIMQISGYFIPHREKLLPVGLIRSPGSWGWATWRRAWAHYNDDAVALYKRIRERGHREFDFNGSYAFLEALRRNADGALDTWAVRWYASMFLSGGRALYPSHSLIRNIGFRDDATNTTPSRSGAAFHKQRIADTMPTIDWSQLGLEESQDFASALEGFYRWQQSEWVRPSWGERLRARWQLLTRSDEHE